MFIILVFLLRNLADRVGIILILALILSKTGIFKKLILKQNIETKDKDKVLEYLNNKDILLEVLE